jgi:hypothetical protein
MIAAAVIHTIAAVESSLGWSGSSDKDLID